MIVADAEVHEWGWRWFLVDLTTGERTCTGTQTYWAASTARDIGERVMLAARDYPITDTTIEAP